MSHSISVPAALSGLAVALTGAFAVPAQAQDDNFYAGKTVTIIVGFSPGGGYDIYARTLGRHLANHIPGKPTVIVQNMPGAGSFTSVRHLDGPAARDGTIITAFNPGLITDTLTNPEKFKIKFTDFAWLGSITRDVRVCYDCHMIMGADTAGEAVSSSAGASTMISYPNERALTPSAIQ